MWQASPGTSKLGSTGMEITRIGLGTWAIGGGGVQWGWGPQRDEESIAAIHRGLDQGLNWIDTAAAYGFGHSEEVVGRALRGLGSRPYVFSKCGQVDDGTHHVRHVLTRDSILGEAQASLRRLGIDAIDLYQMHWPIPDEDIEEGWGAMTELKERGLVRHIGVSNFSTSAETIQPQYSLIERDIETSVLPFARQRGMGVIVYSPMGSGLLTGGITRQRLAAMPDDDWRKTDPRFTEPQLSRHLAVASALRGIASRHRTTAGAVAVAWTLLNPAVDAAIVGFRRPDQVDPIAPAANLELTPQDLTEIEGVLAS
jgi:aryl-alcohol dehydrogenase-like predicted oxidoreductase